MMRSPLIRRMLAASGLVIVLVAMIFVVMLAAVGDLRASGRQARHSEQTIAAANGMQALVVGLESSARGFAISGDDAFLTLWTANRRAFPARASALEQLAGADAGQRSRAQGIVSGIRAYINEFSRPLVAAAQRDPVRARGIVTAGEGRRRVNALRSRFRAFVQSESAASARQSARADASGRRAVAVGIAGVLAAILLILAFMTYLARVVVTPVRAVAAAASQFAEGNYGARAPEGGVGAVRALGIAFNGMVQAVQTSQEELSRFFTLSIEMLGVAGMDGYFKRLNPSFERTLGYATAELESRPFIEFVHPDDRAATLAEMDSLAQGMQTISFENRYRCKDGSYRWLTWMAAPIVESGLLYCAAHDVTERRRAEAEIAELNLRLEARAALLEHQNDALARLVDLNDALLDASVDGIRLVDLTGRTLLANSVIETTMSDVFGLERDATLQERSLVGRLADPASYLATAAAIESDPECATNDVLEIADTRRAFQRHSGPVRDTNGALIGRIIVLREITAEREASRLKSELVATVSHELRTPLASVLGFAELLRQTVVDEETRQRYLEIIDQEAQRLTALVDDFLDLEKIEAGRFDLTLEAFDLALLLQHQIEFFGLQSAAHQLEFDPPDEPLPLIGDRNRIGQVVANLISNAIKYSPAGGLVTVAADLHEETICVSVSDSGIGIPLAQQANLFTRFYRVDSSDTREIGGTGLGLALCKEIVTAHGGTVGLESREGIGSTFWFKLSIARSVGDAGHEHLPSAGQQRPAA